MNKIIAVLFSVLLVGVMAESSLASSPMKADNKATSTQKQQQQQPGAEAEEEANAEAQE